MLADLGNDSAYPMVFVCLFVCLFVCVSICDVGVLCLNA